MSNQPIKREVMRSMISASRESIKFLREESHRAYSQGDLNLVDHCLNIATLGEQDYTLYFIFVNFDDISTEDLQNFFGFGM